MVQGWFVKSPGGVEPLLERLYLLLSFPNAALYSCPGRRVGEAIRWKEGDEAWRAGAPHGVDCFEIVDVPLFEAELYPQYASGSFNKTAGKWGFVSPAADAAAVRSKMSRECMYLDPAAVPGAAAALRRLAADATVGQVYEHVRNHIKPPKRPCAPRRAQGAGGAARPRRRLDRLDARQATKTVRPRPSARAPSRPHRPSGPATPSPPPPFPLSPLPLLASPPQVKQTPTTSSRTSSSR